MTGTSIDMTNPAALRPSTKFGGKMMKLLHSFIFITVFSSIITACSMEESSRANVTNQVENTTKNVTTGIIDSLMMSKTEKEMLKDLVDEGPIFEKSKILTSVINTGVAPVSTGSWIQVDLCTQKGCSVMSTQEMPLEIITPRTDGEAHDLGFIEIDSALLTEVRLTLSDDMGRTTIKSARLKDPLFLQYLAEKARLLIAVENDEKCLKGNCLGISSVTAVPDSPRAKYLYYNPSTGSSRKLDNHVHLDIPEGALPYAQVFMTGIDDQGKDYPKLDIFPRPVLDKPMNITISQEKMISSPGGNDVQDNKSYEIKNLEFIDRYYDVGIGGLRSKNGSIKAIYNQYDCIKALNGFAVQAKLHADP